MALLVGLKTSCDFLISNGLASASANGPFGGQNGYNMEIYNYYTSTTTSALALRRTCHPQCLCTQRRPRFPPRDWWRLLARLACGGFLLAWPVAAIIPRTGRSFSWKYCCWIYQGQFWVSTQSRKYCFTYSFSRGSPFSSVARKRSRLCFHG